AASASRIVAFPSSSSPMLLNVVQTIMTNRNATPSPTPPAPSRRLRGAARSHSPVMKLYGRRRVLTMRSRRLETAVVRALIGGSLDGSRTLRVDVQRELLGAAGDLGDRPLGDVVEAVDLLQLGGDLVDGRSG